MPYHTKNSVKNKPSVAFTATRVLATLGVLFVQMDVQLLFRKIGKQKLARVDFFKLDNIEVVKQVVGQKELCQFVVQVL